MFAEAYKCPEPIELQDGLDFTMKEVVAVVENIARTETWVELNKDSFVLTSRRSIEHLNEIVFGSINSRPKPTNPR